VWFSPAHRKHGSIVLRFDEVGDRGFEEFERFEKKAEDKLKLEL
jgi:hypothetical protein